jgi:phosphatidylglycerophosphate synthase
MEASSLTGTPSVPLINFRSIPTVLTVFRLYAAIPILILYENGFYLVGLAVLIAAEITDYLDGYLARRWKVVSQQGAFLDTLADKLLHVPLFGYFLFSPKPKLPHFFLIRDLVMQIGYGWLLLAIASIEAILITTRFSKTLQKFINWNIGLWHAGRYVDLRVAEKKDAKIFGKIKTWIHAFSISIYTVAAAMTVRSLPETYPVLVPTVVTVAQVLAMVSVVFAILSLQSRFTLRLGKK